MLYAIFISYSVKITVIIAWKGRGRTQWGYVRYTYMYNYTEVVFWVQPFKAYTALQMLIAIK